MAEGTQGQQARMRNFEALVSQPVGLTARGGRTFSLRDDVPTGILLRYRVLPDLAERWAEAEVELLRRFEAEAKEAEAKAAASAGAGADDPDETVSEQFARQREAKEWQLRFSAASRAAMAGVRMRREADVCALCGDIFRWTAPSLTDAELFGTWDETTWGWRGGVFSPDEAEQIVQVFTNLRGIASLPQPSAPGGRPNAAESSPSARPNRARRRAALAR